MAITKQPTGKNPEKDVAAILRDKIDELDKKGKSLGHLYSMTNKALEEMPKGQEKGS